MGRSIIKDLTKEEYDRMVELADMICESEAYTTYTYQGKNKSKLTHHDLFLKMLRGWELGLEPFASLDTLYNEHGRITMQVGAMIALVRASGHMDYYKEERSKDECKITVHRKGDISEPVTYTYTYADAKAMGLTKSDNYKNQPDVMLFNRCASKAMRSMFNDIVQGIYVEGELSDGTPEEEPWDDDSAVKQTKEKAPKKSKEAVKEEIVEEDEIDVEPEDEYEEGELIDEIDEEPEELAANEIEEDDDFDPVVDMIEMMNLNATPEQYEIGMTQFGEWCAENIPDEQLEDYELSEWVFDVLGTTYPIYSYIEYDEETDEEYDERMLPWSPELDKVYKSAIKAHLELNKVGFDEDEAGDGSEDDEKPFEEDVAVPQDAGEDEIVDDIEDDEDDEEWGNWDEDEWEDA